MAGKKGSSPSVYKYYKVDGDKVTNTHKICSHDCWRAVWDWLGVLGEELGTVSRERDDVRSEI